LYETQLRRKLPSFPKRRPTFFDTTTVPSTEAPTTTTEQAFTVTERFETTRFQALEDLFGTAGSSPKQRPVESKLQQVDLLDELIQDPVAVAVALPPLVSNTIEDSGSLLDEVRARTVAITGAKSVGVTRNISARGKNARLLKATGQRRGSNGGSGSRRNRFRANNKSAGASGQRRRGQVSAPAAISDFQVAEERLVWIHKLRI